MRTILKSNNESKYKQNARDVHKKLDNLIHRVRKIELLMNTVLHILKEELRGH